MLSSEPAPMIFSVGFGDRLKAAKQWAPYGSLRSQGRLVDMSRQIAETLPDRHLVGHCRVRLVSVDRERERRPAHRVL
jgi:hypothetical protein